MRNRVSFRDLIQPRQCNVNSSPSSSPRRWHRIDLYQQKVKYVSTSKTTLWATHAAASSLSLQTQLRVTYFARSRNGGKHNQRTQRWELRATRCDINYIRSSSLTLDLSLPPHNNERVSTELWSIESAAGCFIFLTAHKTMFYCSQKLNKLRHASLDIWNCAVQTRREMKPKVWAGSCDVRRWVMQYIYCQGDDTLNTLFGKFGKCPCAIRLGID